MPKRICKCIDNFGFRPDGCTVEIDNANYFYCSSCHTFFTNYVEDIDDVPIDPDKFDDDELEELKNFNYFGKRTLSEHLRVAEKIDEYRKKNS